MDVNNPILVDDKQAGTTSKIDWLAVTFTALMGLDELTPILGKLEYKGDGVNGYKKSFTNNAKVLVLSAGTTLQGTHVVLSSEALYNLSMGGLSTITSLGLMDNLCGQVSRIDLALDFFNSGLEIRDIRNGYQSGQLTSKSRKPPRQYHELELFEQKALGKDDGIEHGDSIYFGSPKSDTMFRCYNKAAEQGVRNGVKWVRIEGQFRHKKAQKISLAVLRSEKLRYVVNASIRDYFTWNNSVFKQATVSGDAEIDPIGRKETDFVAWITQQVAKACAKRAFKAEQDGIEFNPVDLIRIYYEIELERLRKKYANRTQD